MNIAASQVLCLCVLISASFSDAFRLTKEEPEIKLHHKMTKREIRHYFGVDSHDEVPEYEVTTPHRMDPHTGMFSTYKLGNHRSRRSAEPNVWLYNIRALGLNLKLNLSRTRDVIGPKVQVETVHKNGSISYSSPPKSNMLEGHVISEPGSFAVINNNDGLAGMISLLDQLLFVHPLPTHLAKNYGQEHGGGKPHVVYRHHSADETNAKRACHTEEIKQHSRSRRSVDEHAQSSANKVLEMAMIADKFLIENKENVKIDNYLKMVAHIIERLFQDPSAGERKLHVEVVKMVLDEGNSLNIDSKDSSGARLGKLADWGIKNIEKTNGKLGHADVLVYITAGITGGLAMASSTCRYQFGRTVNNDVGLATAIIAAHEIAHSMGIGHDGSLDCPDGANIMSTVLPSGKKALKWSKCSKKAIQLFLSSDESSCLDNEPPMAALFAVDNSVSMPAEYHKKLPGQIYDAKAQCVLQYGRGFYRCPQKKSDCESLMCTNNGVVCRGRNSPPMDGTRCGERHWCVKGECVDDGSPMIDGGWSDWSNYTVCTRTCGGGLKWKTRTCTNPKPQAGGSDCEGSDVGHYAICNPQDCPVGTKTFRQNQCEAKLPGSRVSWRDDPCLLSCIRRSLLYSYNAVADGTRCYSDPRIKHVCARGKCLPTGCDYVLSSGVKHDRCGVCGGDSSSCSFVHGTYTKQWRGYGPSNGDTIMSVPAGSSNIKVNMNGLTYHLLGVRDMGDHYLYNVGRTWSTVVKSAGTKVAYDHEDYVYKDHIFIRGPTTKPLKIMYVGFGRKNPGVTYEYFAKEKSVVTPDQVYWNTSKWSLCSESCAGGIETRDVQCLRKDDNSWVSDMVCAQKVEKPEKERKCNEAPCPPSWYQSSWRPCSKTCGRGQQIREVVCRAKVRQGVHEAVADEKCNLDDKPKVTLERDCNKIACHAEWKPGNWSKCSVTCGPNGVTTRHLECKRLNEEGEYVSVAKRACAHMPELQTTASCNTDVQCLEQFTAPNGRKFIPIGCFREGQFQKGERALPEMVANLRGNINWHNMTRTVMECAEDVSQKDNTFKVFGIQFYGECWSGPNAESTYAGYGWSKNCWKGVGGSKVNFVYTFV